MTNKIAIISLVSLLSISFNAQANHSHTYDRKIIFCSDAAVYPREACVKTVNASKINEQNKDINIDKNKYKSLKSFKTGEVLEYKEKQDFIILEKDTKIEIGTSKHYMYTDKYCIPKGKFAPLELSSDNMYILYYNLSLSPTKPNLTIAEAKDEYENNILGFLSKYNIALCPTNENMVFTVFDKNGNKISEENMDKLEKNGYAKVLEKPMFEKKIKIIDVNRDDYSISQSGKHYEFMNGKKNNEYFFVNENGKVIYKLLISSEKVFANENEERFVFDKIVWGIDLECLNCDKQNTFIVKRTNQYAKYDRFCTNSIVAEKSNKLKCRNLDLEQPEHVEREDEIIAIYQYKDENIERIWQKGDNQDFIDKLWIK